MEWKRKKYAEAELEALSAKYSKEALNMARRAKDSSNGVSSSANNDARSNNTAHSNNSANNSPNSNNQRQSNKQNRRNERVNRNEQPKPAFEQQKTSASNSKPIPEQQKASKPEQPKPEPKPAPKPEQSKPEQPKPAPIPEQIKSEPPKAEPPKPEPKEEPDFPFDALNFEEEDQETNEDVFAQFQREVLEEISTSAEENKKNFEDYISGKNRDWEKLPPKSEKAPKEEMKDETAPKDETAETSKASRE